MKTKQHRTIKSICALLLVVMLSGLPLVMPVLDAAAADQPNPSTSPGSYPTHNGTITGAGNFFYYGSNNSSTNYPNILFCGDNSYYAPTTGSTPQSVTLGTSVASNQDMLFKMLYFGFGGPGNATYPPGSVPRPTGSAAEKEHTITELNIHRAVNGSYLAGFQPTLIPDAEAQWNRINGYAMPTWALEFTPVSSTAATIATVEGGTKVQRSPEIQLTGEPSNNSVKITSTSTFTIRKTNEATPYKNGAVAEIKVGESFYIEAPLGYTGSFSPTNLSGTVANRMVPFMLQWSGSNIQRLFGMKCYPVNVDLSVAFNGLIETESQPSVVSRPPTEVSMPDGPSDNTILIHKYGVDREWEYEAEYEQTGNTISGDTIVGRDADGNPLKLSDLQPLANVPFRITKLLAQGGGYVEDTSFQQRVVLTDLNGVATFDNLPQGIYKVSEEPNNISLMLAQDSIVFVPFYADTGEITNLLHIYPKNIIAAPEIKKEINGLENGTANLGEDVTWTIRTEITRDIAECVKYNIIDVIEPVLTLDTASLSLSFTDTSGSKVTLSRPADYDFTLVGAGANGGGTLTVTVTPAGMAKMASAIPTTNPEGPYWLVTEYKTKITIPPEQIEDYLGKPINNKATLDFKNSAHVEYEEDSNIVEVHLGGFQLIKTDPNDRPLPGAKFKVFHNQEDARAKQNALPDPYNASQDWIISSDTAGLMKIFGLAYGEDGQAYNDPTAETVYWIMEVEPPNDPETGKAYNMLTDPIPITVNATSHLNTPTQVINIRFDLPATGSEGTIWYTALGILVAILSIGAVTLKKRFA